LLIPVIRGKMITSQHPAGPTSGKSIGGS